MASLQSSSNLSRFQSSVILQTSIYSHNIKSEKINTQERLSIIISIINYCFAVASRIQCTEVHFAGSESDDDVGKSQF